VDFHLQKHLHFTHLKSAHPQIRILPPATKATTPCHQMPNANTATGIERSVCQNTAPGAPARIWGPQHHIGRSYVYTLTQLNITIFNGPFRQAIFNME